MDVQNKTDHMRVHKTSVIPGDKWQANDSVSRVRLQCSHNIMCMELLHLSLHSTLLNIMEYYRTPYVGMARGKNGHRIKYVQNDILKSLLYT